MEAPGIEPGDLPCNDKDLQASIAQKYEKRGKNRAPSGLNDSPGGDPVLQAVVDAWGHLPEAVKAGILAMVQAAAGEGGKP